MWYRKKACLKGGQQADSGVGAWNVYINHSVKKVKNEYTNFDESFAICYNSYSYCTKGIITEKSILNRGRIG